MTFENQNQSVAQRGDHTSLENPAVSGGRIRRLFQILKEKLGMEDHGEQKEQKATPPATPESKLSHLKTSGGSREEIERLQAQLKTQEKTI